MLLTPGSNGGPGPFISLCYKWKIYLTFKSYKYNITTNLTCVRLKNDDGKNIEAEI